MEKSKPGKARMILHVLLSSNPCVSSFLGKMNALNMASKAAMFYEVAKIPTQVLYLRSGINSTIMRITTDPTDPAAKPSKMRPMLKIMNCSMRVRPVPTMPIAAIIIIEIRRPIGIILPDAKEPEAMPMTTMEPIID